MNHSRRHGALAFRLSGALVVGLLLGASSPGALAQHDHHKMPTPTPTPTPTPSPARPQQPAPAADHGAHTPAVRQEPSRRRARAGLIPEGPVLTLEELERMAAERNPTLAQAEASVRSA